MYGHRGSHDRLGAAARPEFLARDGYKIENAVFDRRPGFPVTANLRVPTGKSGRLLGGRLCLAARCASCPETSKEGK